MSDNYDSYNSSSNDYSNSGGGSYSGGGGSYSGGGGSYSGGGSTTYNSSPAPVNDEVYQSQSKAARYEQHRQKLASYAVPVHNPDAAPSTNNTETSYTQANPTVNSDPVPENTFSEKRDPDTKGSENNCNDPASVVPPPHYTSNDSPEIIPTPAPATTTQNYSEKVVASAPSAMPQPGAYKPVPQMTVARGPPTKFETGLCDCWGDLNVCCCAFWCSPCLFNRTHAVSENSRMPTLSLEEAEKEWCGVYCVGYYLLAAWTGCGQLFWQGYNRGDLRRQYNLAGTPSNDYLVSCCCSPCALGQEDMEVRRIERARLLEYQNAQQTLAQQNL